MNESKNYRGRAVTCVMGGALVGYFFGNAFIGGMVGFGVLVLIGLLEVALGGTGTPKTKDERKELDERIRTVRHDLIRDARLAHERHAFEREERLAALAYMKLKGEGPRSPR